MCLMSKVATAPSGRRSGSPDSRSLADLRGGRPMAAGRCGPPGSTSCSSAHGRRQGRGGNGGSIAITGAGVLPRQDHRQHHREPLAQSRGGGIYFDDSGAPGAELAIHDSIISDNASGFGGGGIHSSRSAPVTVTRSTVSGNTASHTWRGSEAVVIHGNGGGISAGDLTVVQSRIVGNEAAAYGGGLEGGTVVVTRSTVADNGPESRAGGIFTGHAEGGLRVESSTLTGNYAKSPGAGSAPRAPPVEVNLSTIADNAAPTGGGLPPCRHHAARLDRRHECRRRSGRQRKRHLDPVPGPRPSEDGTCRRRRLDHRRGPAPGVRWPTTAARPKRPASNSRTNAATPSPRDQRRRTTPRLPPATAPTSGPSR